MTTPREQNGMTLSVLIKCLKDLKKRHPSLANEPVKIYWWRGSRSNLYRTINSVNYMTNDLTCVIEIDEEDYRND